MLGILLIDKPSGVTSHDVVNEMRRKLGTRRVGHAGTLDPLATGVLVLAVGPATRFLQYLPLEPKEYVADITFGSTTDTYDREGTVQAGGEVPANLRAALQLAIPPFLGLIRQLPPMFSAIKVKGRPLYQFARKGEEIAREPRTIHITSIDVLELGPDSAKVRVVCSGGTYIRSLAHDLGQKMGCGAHLSGLERLAVGRFRKGEAVCLGEAGPANLISLKEALPPMPLVQLDETQTQHIREGRQIRIDWPAHNYLVGLLEPDGEVFCIARLLGNVVQPECVIPKEAVI